ncbi:MAG: DUF1361 domain-containing protein [Verrucomicrobia bacterium]|nr:DUF1361 domain-containing protein [Verrucomicrobiota bacterium]
MKLIELLYRRETRSPMLALTFASVAGVALVITRMVFTHNYRYAFLVWNLFLAWLPLIFALMARDSFKNGAKNNWRFRALSGAWLLFLPNAPYIFTDVIHLLNGRLQHFWLDLTLILICALTGLVLGFVSLYLMQGVVSRMFGQAVSWLFIAAATGLSGFGIYLGRFLRFNSWDVLTRPGKLFNGLTDWAANPMANSHSLAFPALFAAFLFIAYVMLYALTHLPRNLHMPVETEPAGA